MMKARNFCSSGVTGKGAETGLDKTKVYHTGTEALLASVRIHFVIHIFYHVAT